MAFWIEINCSSSIHILLQTKWEKKTHKSSKIFGSYRDNLHSGSSWRSSNVDKMFINLNFDFDFIIDEQFWINEWMNEWGCQCPKWYDAFAMQMPWIANLCFFSPCISLSLYPSVSFCPHHLCIQAFIFYGICVCNSQIRHMICSQWKLVSYHMNGFCIRVFCLSTRTICHYKLYSINTYFYRAVSFHLSEIVILMLVPSHFCFFFC